MFTLFFTLGEEIEWRGYLLPKLLSLGRTRALLLVGLIWAPWHLVLFFLTPFFPMGNVLIFVPLFVGTIVAASFFFGYLRLYTGSLWAASIGHLVHNAAWGILGALTATSSPVLVNLYLVGDNGILILVATTLGAIWVGYMLRSGKRHEQCTTNGRGSRSDGGPQVATEEASQPTLTWTRTDWLLLGAAVASLYSPGCR